jgi:hypothetical protein
MILVLQHLKKFGGYRIIEFGNDTLRNPLGRLISFAAICTHIWSLLLERRVVQPRLSHNCKFACNILNFLVVLAGYRSSPPLDLTLFKGLDFPFLANVFFMKLSFAKVRCLQLL